MPYPNSFDVFDGMPTAYQHYNNLRADALWLGQNEANAVTLGALLARFESGMNLEIIEPKRLRVTASAGAPVGIVIGGYPLQATANVDLSSGAAPSGPAAEYFVFAVRSTGQPGFSLDVNTTPTETTTRRIIGRCYYDGAKIVKESIRTRQADEGRGALLGAAGQPAGGRLSLVSGSPLGNSSSGSTVYYMPYENGRIGLYVPGLGWKVYSFAEAALPLDGLTAGNYDIFGVTLSGEGYGLTLAAVKWSTDAARATAIVRQDGVWVRNNLPEQRYLGTIRLVSTATAVDDDERRFVWNCYNRAPRRLFKRADATTWTYSTNTWRAANGSNANRVELVVGLEDVHVNIGLSCNAQVTNATVHVGISKDSNSAAPNDTGVHVLTGYSHNANASQIRTQPFAVHRDSPEVGYHYYQWMETVVSGSATFHGSTNAGFYGLFGEVMG
jgi:hypothetical protein